ncbi:MAG: hypothetical protein IT198_17635 [Acidimicrobiia bacterium]|nr:hypothetical protein [Acidimicrobiia bacterium]
MARRTILSHEFLQWFGLLAAPVAWATQFIVGHGYAATVCSPAGAQWELRVTGWEIVLTAVAAAVAVLGEAASYVVFRQTAGAQAEVPGGRHHFFAYASLGGNVLFLCIILLTGIGVLYQVPCIGS